MPLRRLIAFFAVAVALAPVVAFAQEKGARPPKSEVKNGVRIERDIPYVPGGDPSQRLDLYLPEKGGDRPLPLLVWIHGGGWLGGSKGENPGAGLTARGEYASASVEYRFSDKAVFPAQIQDCQAAVRFLRANASKYNVDPDHIGVWGASAGGHLVALLGTAADAKGWDGVGAHADQSARVQAVCDYFGPADFTVMKSDADSSVGRLLGGAVADRKDLARQASPVAYASKDDAPFLIIHGDHDALVPLHQSEMLYDALKQAGIEATFLVVKNGVHGPFDSKCEPKPEQIREAVFGFFDRHLKKSNK
jgi:acetyl esterase/lipase